MHRAFSENANIRAERKGQGVAAVGGHAGRSGIRQRHRQAEAAADLRFIYPAISCIGYGGILRYLLPVDEALEEMRKLLKENKTVRELVKG